MIPIHHSNDHSAKPSNSTMKLRIISASLLLLVAACANLHAADSEPGFGAYHTRLGPALGGDIGKYEDLVVTLGATNRLEFARADGYLP